ncbi:MAG: hypothetical protein HS117_11535 [Verrucomicrobiaceae bacterium]|nr:hypothetical protein [Verrucomicrobiaceae bacterium]
MNIFEALAKLEREPRCYSSNGWFPRVVKPAMEWILPHVPNKKMEDVFQELPDVENGERDLTRVLTVVEWRPADLALVEKAFDVQLPDWAHGIYARISRAVICLRNPIVILPPNEIVEWEVLIRNASEKGRRKLPVRQIVFAKAGIEGSFFALRRHTLTNQWEVALSTVDSTLEEEQGPLGDLRCDPDPDAWMERMIATDGHPLRKGNTFEVCYTDRWDAEE